MKRGLIAAGVLLSTLAQAGELDPQTVAEQIVADCAVWAVREQAAGRAWQPASFAGVTICATVALPARAGGSIDRRSHLERHGPKYAAGVAASGLVALSAAALNNGWLGEPHYGAGTAEQQRDDAAGARADGNTSNNTVTQESGEGGENNSTIIVYIGNIFKESAEAKP
jgi:hypothetical protein